MEKLILNSREDFESAIADYMKGRAWDVDGVSDESEEPTRYPCVMCCATVGHQNDYYGELEYIIVYPTDF